MTQQYLIGELSVRLEQLEAAARKAVSGDVTRLRHQIEFGPLTGLGCATARSLALADVLCWDSLTWGDAAAFARQAAISEELRLFGTCAGLLEED